GVVLEEQCLVVAQERVPVPAHILFGVGVAGVHLVVGNQRAVAGKLLEEAARRVAAFEDQVAVTGLVQEVGQLQASRTRANDQVIQRLRSILLHHGDLPKQTNQNSSDRLVETR